MEKSENINENETHTISNGKETSGTFKKKWFTINRSMVICKLTYILFGGVVGTYAPYLTVFYTSIHFTHEEAGVLAGIRFIVSCFANPLWGYFSDYTKKRKLTLIILCLGSAVTVVPMPWVAYFLDQGGGNSTGPMHTFAPTVSLNQEKSNRTLYYIMLTLSLLSAFFMIPLPGYLDAMCANFVRNHPSKSSYGTQRIFGSLGSSMANYLTGFASSYYHVRHMSPYTPAFCFLLFYLLCTIPFTCRLITQYEINAENAQKEAATRTSHDLEEEKEETKSPPVLRLIWDMIKNADTVFFLASVIVSGVSFNISIYWTLQLIKEETPNSIANMSLALVIASLSNLIMFPISSKVIKLLRGPSQAMLFAFGIYFIRFIVMSYTKIFTVMLFIQVLNGVCFALMWASMIEHIHKIAPKEIVVTVFMMLSSLHFGVCGLVGNIVGGRVFHRYGGRTLFRAMAIICGVWGILMLLYSPFRYFRRRKKGVAHIATMNAGICETKRTDCNIDKGPGIPLRNGDVVVRNNGGETAINNNRGQENAAFELDDVNLDENP